MFARSHFPPRTGARLELTLYMYDTMEAVSGSAAASLDTGQNTFVFLYILLAVLITLLCLLSPV